VYYIKTLLKFVNDMIDMIDKII